MSLSEAMASLEALANENGIKTYRRHGVIGPLFGVRYSEMYKLQKRIKVDHELALALWGTGNYDARILAMLIVDAKQFDTDLDEKWLKDVDCVPLGMELARCAKDAACALLMAEKYKDDPREFYAQHSWSLIAHLSTTDQIGDEAAFAYLDQIESEIHERPNRVRYSMLSALIGFGLRDSLRGRVYAIDDAIGEVYVDHGDTSCGTPNVKDSIEKAMARRAMKKGK